MVRGTVIASAQKAVVINFNDSIQVSLLYNVAAFALSFLFLLLLPSPKNLRGPPPAPAAE